MPKKKKNKKPQLVQPLSHGGDGDDDDALLEAAMAENAASIRAANPLSSPSTPRYDNTFDDDFPQRSGVYACRHEDCDATHKMKDNKQRARHIHKFCKSELRTQDDIDRAARYLEGVEERRRMRRTSLVSFKTTSTSCVAPPATQTPPLDEVTWLRRQVQDTQQQNREQSSQFTEVLQRKDEQMATKDEQIGSVVNQFTEALQRKDDQMATKDEQIGSVVNQFTGALQRKDDQISVKDGQIGSIVNQFTEAQSSTRKLIEKFEDALVRNDSNFQELVNRLDNVALQATGSSIPIMHVAEIASNSDADGEVPQPADVQFALVDSLFCRGGRKWSRQRWSAGSLKGLEGQQEFREQTRKHVPTAGALSTSSWIIIKLKISIILRTPC